jgi:hypothetical protein
LPISLKPSVFDQLGQLVAIMTRNDDTFEDDIGTLWEALAAAHRPLSANDLRDRTGLAMPRLRAGLGRFAEVGLLDASLSSPGQSWCARQQIDALTYARAVEMGIPLDILERTVGVSVQDRSRAQELAANGEVDADRERRERGKELRRRVVLRGRAATRAATTDLARIVQDAQDAWGGDLLGALNSHISEEYESQSASNVVEQSSSDAQLDAKVSPVAVIREAVRDTMRRQSSQALAALVAALERAR